MKLLKRALAQTLSLACAPEHKHFIAACEDPRRAQEECLKEILSLSATTEYGQRFAVNRDWGYKEFSSRLLEFNYDGSIAWVEHQRKYPHKSILAAGGVRVFEKTSGSSGRAKYIPYNRALLQSFTNYFKVWTRDVLLYGPKFSSFKTYMTVSPAATEAEGLSDDSEYLSESLQWLTGFFLAAPGSLKQIRDPFEFRDRLAQHLLAAEDLEILSLWHPSLFLALWEHILLRRNFLVLPRNRAWIGKVPALSPRDVWPKLKLISAWADGGTHASAQDLMELFPGVAFQAKGLLATEAPVTVPLWDKGSVPFLTEVFLEFKDAEGNIFLCDELKEGEEYRILVSQKGGLLRYDLGDLVRVRRMLGGKLPDLEFVRRWSDTSDLVGEKLTAENFTALSNALREKKLAREICALPLASREYCLLYEGEGSTESVAIAAEAFLQEYHHYQHARKLGQLKPVRALAVRGLSRELLRFYTDNKGMKAGDIKLRPLVASRDEAEALHKFIGGI